MAEKRSFYQAADGTIWDTEAEADAHDMSAALEQRAVAFLDKRLNEGQKTLSRNKAISFMVAFTLSVIMPEMSDDDEDDADGSASRTTAPETDSE